MTFHRIAFAACSVPLALLLAAPLGCHHGGGGTGGGGGEGAAQAAPKGVDCVHTGSTGKDYEVGPGLEYTTLGAVPWETLGPGDSVRIHATSDAYHEKFLISTRGTEQAPILVCGIPDDAGHLPIIDAANATTRPGLAYGQGSGIEPYSLVAVYNDKAAVPGGQRAGYITIANLQLQGARGGKPYTNASGAHVNYPAAGPAALNVFGADHVTIAGNIFTDSDEGLFVNSKDYTDANGYDYAQSRDLLIQGNVFTNNGIPNNYYVHHAYTEAIGIVFEYNYFGRLTDLAQGNAVSDRSAGLVVRYNLIDGGAHLVGMGNPQASWGNVKTNLEKDPSLKDAYVYGNILVDRHNPNVDTTDQEQVTMYSGYSSRVVFYGGTDMNYDSYRGGTLYFYNNTLIVEGDQAKHYNTALFEVYTDPSTPLATKVDARNNILVVHAATKGLPATNFLLEISNNKTFGDATHGQGDLTFDTNWITAGWAPSFPKSQYYDPTTGSITTMNFIQGPPGGDPGFVDLANGDYHLKAGSAAIDKGVALDPAVVQAGQDVQFEYVSPGVGAPRTVNGSAIDLGAYEAN